MGWFIAIGLAGVMCGMGFKAPGDKVGTVDIGKVFSDSDYSKKQQQSLSAAKAARVAVLDLVNTYRVMRPDDAQKFHDIALKDKPLPEDKTEQDRITQAAKDADALYRALATKSSPSTAELAQIEDLNRRKDSIGVLQQKWTQEFNEELSSIADKLQADALAKVREAIAQVGRDQGFSVVFATSVAPYSANDLTEASTKLMNKNNK
jgi:Skp family chaperone for outer membrane proteins